MTNEQLAEVTRQLFDITKELIHASELSASFMKELAGYTTELAQRIERLEHD